MVMDENTSMEPGNMVWLNLNMSNQIHVYMYPSVHMWHACTYIRLSVDNCFACKDAYEQPRDSESSEDSEKEENDLSTEDALVCEALVQVSAQSVEETNKDALVCESLIQVITQSTEETNQTVYPVHMITQSVEEPNEDDLVHEISVEETPHVQLDPLTHPEDVVKVEAKEKTAVNIEFEFSVKAQFSYSPKDDPHIPRVDLGMSFDVGDILHVIDQRDPNWWQVVKEKEIKQYAGLVPSRRFQESLATINMKQRTIAGDPEQKLKKKRRFQLRKKRKNLNEVTSNSETLGQGIDVDELLSYEEVVKVNPDPNYRRPIFVIGPAGINERAIIRELTGYSSRFASPIPDTCREREPYERNGIEYNFIEQNSFCKRITQNQYVQGRTRDGNWFGTPIRAVRDTGLSGKVAVVPAFYQTLKPLGMADLKPYIVYLKPKAKWTSRSPYGTSGYAQNDELDMIQESKRIEARYAHYFDFTLMVEDIQQAAEELVKVADRLQNERQWVYASWVR
jgi:MAGUK p55 subfamily protein 5